MSVKRHAVKWLGLLVLGSALGAQAQTQAPVREEAMRGQGWSVLGAQTQGRGHTALVGQVGWPGASLGVLHGVDERVDLGGLLSANYGEEGIVTRVRTGLKLQAWARLMLLQSSRVQLGLNFAPGPFIYFDPVFGDRVGLTLPLRFVVGLPVSSAVMLNLGLDMPFYTTFGPGGGPVLPVLVGGGLEYFIDRSLAATFNVRMGPTLFLYPGDSRFTLDATFGLAWRP
jgi:hypothetical protein